MKFKSVVYAVNMQYSCCKCALTSQYKISFKKEGLPSSVCFNCFVRHLGTFFGTR